MDSRRRRKAVTCGSCVANELKMSKKVAFSLL
jgi:hypothetical protein